MENPRLLFAQLVGLCLHATRALAENPESEAIAERNFVDQVLEAGKNLPAQNIKTCIGMGSVLGIVADLLYATQGKKQDQGGAPKQNNSEAAQSREEAKVQID